MPYIKQEVRDRLDPFINQLAMHMRTDPGNVDDTDFAGILNYTCTRLAIELIVNRGLRYWMVAIISGVFHNIGTEFYRRVGVPYEDYQIDKNGDLFDFAQYQEKFKKGV